MPSMPSTTWARCTSPAWGRAAPPAPTSTTEPCGGWAWTGATGGGSAAGPDPGRELCWFPDPVGPADCYRARLPDALLLVNALGDLDRVTARMAATRRDRLTARWPMLRRPHPEGTIGAVRAEVRGRRDGAWETLVYGAYDRPGVAAGAVAAVAATALVDGELGAAAGGERPGRSTRARPLLEELARRGRQGRGLHRVAGSGIRDASPPRPGSRWAVRPLWVTIRPPSVTICRDVNFGT